MKKKSSEKSRRAITAARYFAKYERKKSSEPRKSIIAHVQSPDARYRTPIEELERLLAEARVVGDAKYERLQRLRKYSTYKTVNIVPTSIEKSAKRVGKL